MLALVLPETSAPILLPLGITLALATVVLISIALDLRRLRRTSQLRVIHGVIGAASTALVLCGALAMSMALGSAPAATATATATADTVPSTVPVSEGPASDNPATDITDIQLPTLMLDEDD